MTPFQSIKKSLSKYHNNAFSSTANAPMESFFSPPPPQQQPDDDTSSNNSYSFNTTTATKASSNRDGMKTSATADSLDEQWLHQQSHDTTVESEGGEDEDDMDPDDDDDDEEDDDNDDSNDDSNNEMDSYYDITEHTFNEMTDVPITWREAEKAERIHYSFHSQLLPEHVRKTQMRNETKFNKTQFSAFVKPKSSQPAYDQLTNIKEWEKFVEYRHLIVEVLDETRGKMRELLTDNLDSYVNVEKFNRDKIRDADIICADTWKPLHKSYDSLQEESDKLYSEMIDTLLSIEDAENILSLAEDGKWKKMFQLRDEVREAIQERHFPKVLSVYHRMKLYKKRTKNSALFQEKYFSILEAEFNRARNVLLDIVCDYGLPFVQRELSIRYLRDLEVTEFDPGQYVLVSQYKRFQRTIFQAKCEYKNRLFDYLMDVASSMMENSVNENSVAELIGKKRRDLAIQSLNELCQISLNELTDFLKLCNITLTHPDFVKYKKHVESLYEEHDDLNLITDEPMTPQRHAAILRLILYSRTFDPAYLMRFDDEELIFEDEEKLLPKNIQKIPINRALYERDMNIVITLVTDVLTSKVSVDIAPKMTAGEFSDYCRAQFCNLEEEDEMDSERSTSSAADNLADVSDLIFMTPSKNEFIYGDQPLYEHSYIFQCLNNGQQAKLVQIRKSDVLFPPRRIYARHETLQYHKAFDLLTVQDMLENIATLFQHRCSEFYSEIDDGSSYQPPLFSSMECVIRTTEKFVTLLSQQDMTVSAFEENCRSSRQYAVNTAVERFIQEIKELSVEEDWEMVGTHTKLPDLFYHKCKLFIYLMREIVCPTQAEHIKKRFLSFFKAYSKTYNRMILKEKKNVCEEDVTHIAEQPFFNQLLIVMANITYTLQDVYPGLVSLFEDLFHLPLSDKKTLIKSQLSETLVKFKHNYVDAVSEKLQVITQQHLDNLKAFFPLKSKLGDESPDADTPTGSSSSQYLSSNGVNLIVRYNHLILHELSLVYSNLESVGLKISEILNPIIHEVTVYLKEQSSEADNNSNQYLLHSQCILWNYLFVESHSSNEMTREVMREWMAMYPSEKKVHAKHIAACRRLLEEYPIFSTAKSK